ncbi:hypothetical protein HUE87_01685 [Candidatus Sulfurimonas marisnigri]|uniref:Prokaryotic metallothionein n=1 Tax=Candidatus Sulfurimonas marisnigri TaxID=2740405 RepID=A0A7S7M0Y7_9BACT|nr:PP0621 family protein [Candidatus Sulfurimonas marisnigri]QOY54983.1 hypothetical protein HUE87_01685 [Candidatus Sulfurimonas marisnigri]
MILKVLLLVGVIAVVYFFFIKKKPAVTQSNKNSKKNKVKDEVQSSDMVECSTCGIYCALDDTLLSNNKYYCSTECLEKA